MINLAAQGPFLSMSIRDDPQGAINLLENLSAHSRPGPHRHLGGAKTTVIVV
jgi:hypothetical protein